MKRIDVNLNKSYPIYLESNLFNNITSFFDTKIKKLFVIDSNVSEEYENKVRNIENSYIYRYGASENNKCYNAYLSIINFLLENNFNKDDMIIGMGGGITTDIVGYVASTYKRKMKLAFIPTTTLCMVDACIGGKNGINYKDYKNMIGTIYQPEFVLIDFDILKTLDERNYINGLYESLKCGLLKDKVLFSYFENNTYKENIEDVIYRSLLVKKHFIENDVNEDNIRIALNLGHTIGHALERASNFKIYHGESIAIGLVYELDNPLKNKVKKILDSMNLDYDISLYLDKIKENILKDKKNNSNGIKTIKLNDIGDYEIIEKNPSDFF